MAIYNVLGEALSSCFSVNGDSLSAAYNVSGNVIFQHGDETDYSKPTIQSYKNISIANCQGMEIYNDVLFQFRGTTSNMEINNLVSLFNFSSGSTVYADMPIVSGHANAVAFSKTFYNPNDEFPILYCGDWFDPIVHVNRITRTGATHLYDIVYDVANAGYHSNPCIDFDNNIMYTVGYYQNSTSDSTNNYCIVCKWDLSNMTDNGDGTFTPALLSKYTRDYIYIMQDLKFNDGLVWIAAGGNNNPEYVYGMNPNTGVFVHTITMPITTEIEGIVWFKDEQTELYYAYIGFQTGKYYKMTFPKVS